MREAFGCGSCISLMKYVEECAHSKSDLAEFTEEAMGPAYSL